ncbi:MAG: anhydro-N-acetylmuramic acid kinase [Methylovulum sp.]|nr:anhydro-N-acetylmuramic acid kinase [Methylovulum sp.]
MPEFYIGLMSGTSVDGIDASLVDFSDGKVRLVDFFYQPFTADLKAAIEHASKPDTLIALQNYGTLDAQLGQQFADAANALLTKAKIPASSITAIGSHGQTIYHSPDNKFPFSLQIGDPNLIAEKTGITTVADFRRRDMAANGQGAPLVPAFHQAVFSHPDEDRCVVNIGGIANITVLPANQSAATTGFDTGPGNTLMDQWIHKHQGVNYDSNGIWAKTGQINDKLVALLKHDTYFHTAPPKSTGKEYFSIPWLEQKASLSEYYPEDIQASLCHLTATTICDAIKKYAPATERTLICGGGIHNDFLLQLIKQNLQHPVASTETQGIHPDHVEAMAFAWLAWQRINNLPGNLKEVTGASRPVILGGIYS